MSQWVTVFTFTYPHEAHVLKTRLESEGILVSLKNENMVQVYNFMSNAIGGVRLQVPEPDVPRAMEIIKEGGWQTDRVKEDSFEDLMLQTGKRIPLLKRMGAMSAVILFLFVIVLVLLFMFSSPVGF